MYILVTGGCGFIGTNLVLALLRSGYYVTNIDCHTYAANNLYSILTPEQVSMYSEYLVDISNKIILEEVMSRVPYDALIHLAAESHVDNSIVSPGQFIQTNVIGTFNLLELHKKYHPDKRFVSISTDEVYGSLDQPGNFGFNESSPLSPNSPYSASKASADMLCRAYHETYGLDILITRCSNNYGPYQHREKFLPKAITSLLRREPMTIYGDGSNIRDWIHVSDHCTGIITVLARGKSGEVYNIGASETQSNLEMMIELSKIIGYGAWTFVQDRPGHDKCYAINSRKLQQLAWTPKVELKKGLADTVEWYRSRL